MNNFPVPTKEQILTLLRTSFAYLTLHPDQAARLRPLCVRHLSKRMINCLCDDLELAMQDIERGHEPRELPSLTTYLKQFIEMGEGDVMDILLDGERV